MRCLTFGLFAALAAAGCSPEITGPAALANVSSFSEDDAGARLAPIYSAEECRVPDPPPGTIPWSNSAPALESYCVAYWVTQGLDEDLTVGFASTSGTRGRWFLQLFVPASAQFVDENGMPVAPGQPVRVTIAVHPTLYAVRFGPHGSGFTNRKAAVLKLNYSWAELGKNDANHLSIYYQPDEDSAWEREPTIVDKKGNFVYTWLHHFSNYAVAW